MRANLTALLQELEEEYGGPVQLQATASGKRHLRTIGDLTQRPLVVVPVEGKGAEYDIAQKLGGSYQNIRQVQKKAERVVCDYLPPRNTSPDAPMNISRIEVTTYGIFARVSGTYEPDGILKPHPGYEGPNEYDLKIADVNLALIE